MRILITGGRGFVGSHLASELTSRGHVVVPLGRNEGDLTEMGVAEGLLERHDPEVVVHLAARVGRAPGEQDPVETVRQNVGATLLLARACAGAGVRLAHGSTSEVYGATGEQFASEDEQLSVLPEGAYGLSKRWSEEAALRFCPDSTLVRLSMPYGPGVRPGRQVGAIVTMLDQARRRRPIPAYRDTVRSWCWVGDAARAIALLLEEDRRGPWNVGRDDEPRSMVEIARLACHLTGAPESLIEETDPPNQASAIHRVSTAKLRALGWTPDVKLEQGMKTTRDWLVSVESVP